MEIHPPILPSVLHVNFGDNGEYIKALYDFPDSSPVLNWDKHVCLWRKKRWLFAYVTC